ncbi:endoribonuclease Dicer homolog 3a-like isoform X1 [Daucus carota subsp. sativus]|uniref:endoribonuclease Dicer homolog 3a-like isoform X1 n=1 Tax=Daucus carota subsp. sativus TaxID=79200 RepID=UPI0030839C65
MQTSEADRVSKKRRFDSLDHNPPPAPVEKMDVDIPSLPGFTPRMYQRKIFKVATKRNTIAHLDTGAGKTLIAVMLIKEVAKSVKLSGEKRVILFLAPTVALVHQQYKFIKDNTELEVDEYYGAKGVDFWDAGSWEKEIDQNDVMVMTPQILLDALRKAFLKFGIICLLIFDECHHATRKHPYAKLMEEFYHNSEDKPKVFGMTASPVIKKGVSSVNDSEHQISELESILDSQIYSVEIKKEQDLAIPSTKELLRFYDPAVCSSSDLKRKLESTWLKFDGSLLKLQASLSDNFRDTDEKQKLLRSRMSNIHQKILYCINDLGLMCAFEAVKILTENSPEVNTDCEFYMESSLQYKYYLEEVLSLVEESLPQGHESLLDEGHDYAKTVSTCFISPKLYELLQIFQSFGEAKEVLCLVFVEQIITAKAIERVFKKINYLSHLSASYLTGTNNSVDALTPKLQKEILDSFRSGKVNLLFTTDVVEEGIDVPNCSTVIRFDLPTTVRSYVQSRGRARQDNSQYLMMLERGNLKQRDQMFDIIQSEYLMRDTALKRKEDSSSLKPWNTKDISTYVVPATGASVTADSSVGVIYRYCEKLPHDKYYSSRPSFQILSSENFYQCVMTLPPNAAFKSVIGPFCGSTHLSKQLVCLDACKKLHELGALNDQLLPINEQPEKSDSIVKNKASSAGTTKRKELHGTTCIQALSGTWGEMIDNMEFFAYKIDFVCDDPDVHYSSFILLVESRLADDVGNFEVDLHLIDRVVKSSVSSCGQVPLDAEQVRKSKCFQEFLFNGIFGKLIISQISKKGRQILLQNNVSLWKPSYMYLLLPLESAKVPSQETWKIDWAVIETYGSAIEFFKLNAWLSAEQSGSVTGGLKNNDLIGSDVNCVGNIQFANGILPVTDIKDMVVLSVHTGKVYSVIEVLLDLSADSTFDGYSDEAPINYASFTDYFQKQYGMSLLRPEQPLLLLKQSHKAHNLLIDYKEAGFLSKKRKETSSKKVDRKPYDLVRMPPELLVFVDVGLSVLKSVYLLPSLVHRLESLMLASQLREEIKSDVGNVHISSSLILEALTTTKCGESFSMERLELLGDSVLKYAISCYLFLKYPNKHEGQLSDCRINAIRNSTLHKLGTDKKIQGYIRDNPFDPGRWTAPGQQSIRLFPCEHGVDTADVPLDSKFVSEDTKVMIGKCCDRGHRWMSSKTISDCVEALIGAYYVGGGLVASIQLMKWLGMDVEVQHSLLYDAMTNASLNLYSPKAIEIGIVESKLGYQFLVKGLLLEAITHASGEQATGRGYCYQRLEFLGDSVLDLLITWYLYQMHKDIDPGELTDLRAASVNNENFAAATVRKNLHFHLQHSSGLLQNQITEFARLVSGSYSNNKASPPAKCPKALGDLLESIAGAILIDSKLNLEEVWRIFKPILSPIVTPDKLELPPLRELNELCDSLGLFVKDNCLTKGAAVFAELSVQLNDTRLFREGWGQSRKAAKAQAALQLLKDLEDRGISRRKQNVDSIVASSSPNSAIPICNEACTESLTNLSSPKRHKAYDGRTTTQTPSTNGSKNNMCVLESIRMTKGGPRNALYDVCKKQQWPLPKFTTTEKKSRYPMEIGEGSEMRQGFSSFVSQITLTIPNYDVIVVSGHQRADKKSSYDSACLLMLSELEQRGFLSIAKS